MERNGVRRLTVIDANGSVSGVLAVDDVIGHVTGELGELVSLLAHEREKEVERRP
jgi:CBS domain containing-hemolysin-like protein